MKYQVFIFENTKICQPSSDYYARGNDWQEDNIIILRPASEKFDTQEEAIKEIAGYNMGNDQYTILPVWSIEK